MGVRVRVPPWLSERKSQEPSFGSCDFFFAEKLGVSVYGKTTRKNRRVAARDKPPVNDGRIGSSLDVAQMIFVFYSRRVV